MEFLPTLWLIPARGGSKGIPDKNIKPFCGTPLVIKALSQAQTCASPDDTIFVSTDSQKIKALVEENGVPVPFMRPDELSGDTASTYSAIMHALDEFGKRGKEFSRIVLLQPTSPFRNVDDIKGALALWTPSLDMVVSVCEARTNPYYSAFEENSEGFLKISKGNGEFTRRQDAPSVVEYNGAVYVISVSSLEKGPFSSFSRILPYRMETARSIDLDTPEDWLIAEYLYTKTKGDNLAGRTLL